MGSRSSKSPRTLPRFVDETLRSRRYGQAVAAAALALTVGIALALSRAYPEIGNRLSFGWDAARRAMLDVAAADALRQGNVLEFLGHVLGPATWPTLRLTVAAPLAALLG